MLLAQSLSAVEGSNNITLSDEIKKDDSTEEVCRKLLNTNITVLSQTLDKINYSDIDKAVTMMEEARLIHLFGVGSSCVMALEAKNRLSVILPNIVFSEDCHMQNMASALLEEQDLAIAFSYSGSSKDTIAILKQAKQNHAKTICITRFAESPLTAYADIVLPFGANEGPFQGGSLSVRIAQIYLLDILYTEYFKRNYSKCDVNKIRTAESVAPRLL
jgi:DNA-binding MurR/RpiR family transcriptional regulator